MITTNTHFFDWVRTNSSSEPVALRLKYAGKNDGFDYSEAITQIECRKKFGRKLAQTLASFPDFYFPGTLAGEQASSDLLAEYHQSLVPEGSSVVDLTSGLGIDVLHIARRAASVVAVEQNPILVEALKYNSSGLKLADVVKPVCSACEDFIDKCIADGHTFDMAFIDPARRAEDGSRLFALADCSPDVVTLLPKLAKICHLLVIKASPMLDITHTVLALSPAPVAVAAVGNTTECKELVISIVFDKSEPYTTMLEAVTLRVGSDSSTFAFTSKAEQEAPGAPTSPAIKTGDIVCEPYPSAMKAGAFKLLAATYGLRGFHANTKLLYTSAAPQDFPGSLWSVVEVMPYASKNIKRFKSKYPAISVAARNFGVSADALRLKLGVREAPGDLRLFAITDTFGNKQLIVTRSLR